MITDWILTILMPASLPPTHPLFWTNQYIHLLSLFVRSIFDILIYFVFCFFRLSGVRIKCVISGVIYNEIVKYEKYMSCNKTRKRENTNKSTYTGVRDLFLGSWVEWREGAFLCLKW